MEKKINLITFCDKALVAQVIAKLGEAVNHIDEYTESTVTTIQDRLPCYIVATHACPLELLSHQSKVLTAAGFETVKVVVLKNKTDRLPYDRYHQPFDLELVTNKKRNILQYFTTVIEKLEKAESPIVNVLFNPRRLFNKRRFEAKLKELGWVPNYLEAHMTKVLNGNFDYQGKAIALIHDDVSVPQVIENYAKHTNPDMMNNIIKVYEMEGMAAVTDPSILKEESGVQDETSRVQPVGHDHPQSHDRVAL